MNFERVKFVVVEKLVAVMLLGIVEITGVCSFEIWPNLEARAQVTEKKDILTQEDVQSLMKDQNVAFEISDGKVFKIPDMFTEIGDYAFDGCISITKIVIPNCVTKIGKGAFAHCKSLSEIEIPESVTKIGKSAFVNCNSLTEIKIPNSVNKIEDSVFCNCKNLKQVDIPESITEIGKMTFCVCKSLTQVNIPFSVTKIGPWAFWGCSSLNEVTIPNSVTEIGMYTFSRCIHLTKVNTLGNITEIGANTFAECRELAEITIPNGVTKIDKRAFMNCESLKYIGIPKSVTEIGNRSFNGCKNLEEVEFSEINNDSEGSKGLPNLIIGDNAFAISGIRKIGIPGRTVSIGLGCFEKCPNLERILLLRSDTNKGILIIGEKAFLGCENLKSVEGPCLDVGPMLYFSKEAFADCVRLNIFKFNGGELYFEEGVFHGCNQLNEGVIFPWKGEYKYKGDPVLLKAFEGTPFCERAVKL